MTSRKNYTKKDKNGKPSKEISEILKKGGVGVNPPPKSDPLYIGQIIKYSIDPNSEINEIYLENYKLYSLNGELILEGLENSGVYLQKGDFYSLEIFND